MTVTLITGANKGIGREAARRLLELGHTVYDGARDAGRGQAAADELGASHRSRIENRLDILINNAGIYDTEVGTAGLTARDSLKELASSPAQPLRTRTLHLERAPTPTWVE